ncbi:MAG: RNA polymerase subunit sigma-24, partial [Anaerolineae bacterium]
AGREAVRAVLAAAIFTAPTPGEWRLRPTRANARPAVGLFRRDPASGAHRPFAVQVLQVDGAHIGGIVTFLAPGLFSYFGLA